MRRVADGRILDVDDSVGRWRACVVRAGWTSGFDDPAGRQTYEGKTKVLKFKAENSNPITLDGKTLEDVESFTYLGSIVDGQGGSDVDVKITNVDDLCPNDWRPTRIRREWCDKLANVEVTTRGQHLTWTTPLTYQGTIDALKAVQHRGRYYRNILVRVNKSESKTTAAWASP
ncbi:unnamed protein product [Schistosoma curassoni]|uniref:Fibronectin type-III domain-containing protein n=1 Tax=Schistosoma curassoni TaxID=6186 RepID=A0A183K9G7_9TREM|nr:unnamed protein product [Schistosoma curassoni]